MNTFIRTLGGLCSALSFATAAAQPVSIAAASCDPPPAATCTTEDCTAASLDERGTAVAPDSGRTFFLDYPCDLQPGEKVTFIMSLHGAGSVGNWQRHYFPALDYKDKYRLVIATPTAATADPIRVWTSAADDAYLQGIVDLVTEQFGKDNISAFWLAGHSQGGITAYRLICTPYFRDRADGVLSLSGTRIGRVELPADFFGANGGPPRTANSAPAASGAALPDCEFSYIFTAGELEIVELPTTSPWADKYKCSARVQGSAIVDTRKGYVDGGGAADRPVSMGKEARPGSAEPYIYPGCADDRVVADVVRLDKGHTEGLEPLVTEYLINMMVGAPGGKIRNKSL